MSDINSSLALIHGHYNTVKNICGYLSKTTLLGIGLLALNIAYTPKAWAIEVFRDTFYDGTKNIVVVEKFSASWIGDKKETAENLEAMRKFTALKSVNITQMAAEYVRENLDKDLLACIKVVDTKSWDEYASDYRNLFLTITYGISQEEVDGKKRLLAGLYINVTRPPVHDYYKLIAPNALPTQAIVLAEDPSKLRSDFSIAIGRLLREQVKLINTSNSCKKG